MDVKCSPNKRAHLTKSGSKMVINTNMKCVTFNSEMYYTYLIETNSVALHKKDFLPNVT